MHRSQNNNHAGMCPPGKCCTSYVCCVCCMRNRRYLDGSLGSCSAHTRRRRRRNAYVLATHSHTAAYFMHASHTLCNRPPPCHHDGGAGVVVRRHATTTTTTCIDNMLTNRFLVAAIRARATGVQCACVCIWKTYLCASAHFPTHTHASYVQCAWGCVFASGAAASLLSFGCRIIFALFVAHSAQSEIVCCNSHFWYYTRYVAAGARRAQDTLLHR